MTVRRIGVSVGAVAVFTLVFAAVALAFTVPEGADYASTQNTCCGLSTEPKNKDNDHKAESAKGYYSAGTCHSIPINFKHMKINRQPDNNGDYHVSFNDDVKDVAGDPAGSAKITGKFVSANKVKLKIVHHETGGGCTETIYTTLKRF